MTKTYHINLNNSVAFKNQAAYCVGTGRLGLALRHEYLEQLKQVQADIGFSYIRGHGLFCDDLAIYHSYMEDGVEKEEYNFRYIDMVFDAYLSLGIRPFVELGFMPGQMASGEQTIFYWKGNVTPPVCYDKWRRLLEATIRHWMERYGREEVLTWPFEVWNEPNLAGFWQDANMEEYFKLYDVSSRTIKAIDPGLKVGGPSICGVDDERWMRCFLEYCLENDVPLDFVTRHAYGSELPEEIGHYVYQELRTPEQFMEEPLGSRRIIDSFPTYAGMDMHLTEFNTSYSPRNPIHDTNRNAAYIAYLLSVLGDSCASYSYWTFGDVFEESGVAFTPFSGSFGLMANGGIKKPSYWTFVFYKDLYDEAVARAENFVLTKSVEGNLRGVAWNLDADILLRFSVDVPDGTYFLFIKTVDEDSCNPLKLWLAMGSPAYPKAEQLSLLQEGARPHIAALRLAVEGGALEIELPVAQNAVCFFELQGIKPEVDRGFKPEKVGL